MSVFLHVCNECVNEIRKAWVKYIHKSFVKKIWTHTYAIIDLTKVFFFTRSDRKIGLVTIKPFDSLQNMGQIKYSTLF